MENIKQDHPFIKELQKNNYKDVAIFIDFDNLELSLRNFGLSTADPHFSIITTIIEAYARKSNVQTVKAFGDFNALRLQSSFLEQLGVEAVNVPSSVHSKPRKNASDHSFIIDAMETLMLRPNISTYVLVTSDQDFAKLAQKLNYYGKTVHIFYLATHIASVDYFKSYSKRCIDLIEVMGIDLARAMPDYWLDKFYQTMMGWFNKNGASMGIPYKQLQYTISSGFNMSHDFVDQIIHLATKEALIVPDSRNNCRSYLPGKRMSEELQKSYYQKTA